MKIFCIIAIILLLLVSLLNKKISIFKIIKSQFAIYKNDKTKKISFFDIFTFFISPLLISIGLVFVLDGKFIFEKAELIITILSIVATILFSFLAMLVDRKNIEEKDKTKQVISETYISIIMTIIYSIITVVFLVLLLAITQPTVVIKILEGFIYYFIYKVVVNILMIIKRMFLIIDK